jgi:hydrogenase maturation protein HypF
MVKQILIYGVVQGVGFRPTVYRIASELGLNGYVRNNGSNVEVVIDGDPDSFISKLKNELPPLARLDRIEVNELALRKMPKNFGILKSRQGSRDAPIPPDTATCDDCLKEIFNPDDRRYGYPFTNCTNCGARFSVIVDMPYDRPETSMHEFRLCKQCNSEYKDPLDRRFHAQTISCRKDGPRFTLYDRYGNRVKTDNPIRDTAQALDRGDIAVIKGWGGMHIACRIKEIPRLREWYHRPGKPFAIMVRDLETTRKYVKRNDFGEKLLSSPERPVVLLHKSNDLLEGASPGLGNVGLFLPYSGMHHLLFSHLKEDALVMTSANPAGEPMLLENDEAFDLGLDLYLLHNRRIVNRVDDTVLIPFIGRKFFIRKSRGYTPLSLPVEYDETILSVGPERNVNASISKARQMYTTQYIGHTYKYNVVLFLDHGIRYLMRLLGIEHVDAVGIDLHPQYPTRKVGQELAREFGADVCEIQHHYAHLASLLVDNNLNDRMVCLSVDGTGYGPDGTVWGGEILEGDFLDYNRVGTLESLPLPGGDAAIMDPKRVVFAVKEELGLDNTGLFPDVTADLLRKLGPKSIRTTSLGRVLDALSCWLGIGTVRTYDGEPAMKLERYLEAGKRRFDFSLDIEGSSPKIVMTKEMFGQLDGYLHKGDVDEQMKADLARSFVCTIVDAMVDLAISTAEDAGLKYVGWSGGVAYNLPMTRMVEERIQRSGMELLMHDNVPSGDGGISVGQNAIIGYRRMSKM